MASDAAQISLKAVFFDLDGTLVDSLPDMAEALNEVMVAHGLAPHAPAAVARMIGKGVAVLVARAFEAAGRPIEGAAHEAAVAEFLKLYEPRASRLTRLFEGAEATLDRLRQDGLQLAVCTNKPGDISRQILADLDIADRFDLVVGGDAGPPRKPAPDLLLHVAATLGLPPAAAIMVGDSSADVEAAKAAGMRVVAVDWGYTAVAAADLGADRVISRFADLLPLVDGWRGGPA